MGILIFLSVLRGLPRTEIENRFRGIMKVGNSMSQNLKESIEWPPELAICSKQVLKKHQEYHIILLHFEVC